MDTAFQSGILGMLLCPWSPYCGLVALGKRKGLLHSGLEVIRSSEGKQATSRSHSPVGLGWQGWEPKVSVAYDRQKGTS